MARQAGTGSIDRRGDRWRVRIRLAGGARRTLGYYDTREEAERVLAAALLELRGTIHELGRGLTLGAWGERWLERRELTRSTAISGWPSTGSAPGSSVAATPLATESPAPRGDSAGDRVAA